MKNNLLKKLLFSGITLSMMTLGIVHGETLTLAGPVLNYHNTGWSNTGLQITALKNVMLNSFTFSNYGASDTIELTDTSEKVLYSLAVPKDSNASTLIISDWSLSAGNTYNLISLDPNNSMWSSYASFPTSNAQIKVDGGYGQGSLQTDYWFHFNNLTTSTPRVASTVPEPETYATLLAGLGLMGFMVRRRKTS